MATRRTTFDGKVADIYSSALDPTNQPQAATQQDVLNQDFATRLWQNGEYVYGKQRKEYARNADIDINATDRSGSQRGMGRSSYLMQTLANLRHQKEEGLNDIYSAQIADYQSRLTEQENADRQIASNWLNAIIAAGGTPSDDLLRRAGISRSDAMAMIQQPKSSGGGSSGGTPKPSGLEGEETETPPASSELDKLWNDEQPKSTNTPAVARNTNAGRGGMNYVSLGARRKDTSRLLPYQVNPTSRIR